MSQIFAQLNMEWADSVAASVVTWDEPCLHDCETAADVLAVVPSDPNTILGVLLRRAQAGEHLAGRIVLQAMLGKLIRMANSGRARGVDTAGDDLVTMMWDRIMTLPADGRRKNLAASLALDTLSGAQRFWDRNIEIPPDDIRLTYSTEWEPEPQVSEDLDAHAIVEVAADLAWVTPSDAEVLRGLYQEGLSVAQVAQTLEMSSITVYRRRKSGLNALRSRAADLLAVA